jgi:hypothetical protein
MTHGPCVVVWLLWFCLVPPIRIKRGREFGSPLAPHGSMEYAVLG